MQQFYIAREGEAYGPLSVEETNRLALEGTLDRSTLVWDVNRNDWIDASAHPVIARIFDRHISNFDESEADLITREVVTETVSPKLSGEEARCRDEISRLEVERATLVSSIAATQERLAAIEESTRAASEEGASLEERRLATAERVRELTASVSEAKRELSDLLRDRDRTREETNALEVRRTAYDVEIAHVDERLAAIREETTALEKKRIEAEALLGREVSAAFDEIRGSIGDLGRLTSAWSEFKGSDEEQRRAGLQTLDEMARRIREREEELARLFESVGDRVRIEGERSLAETAREEAQARAIEVREELKSLTVLCWEELQNMEAAREERGRIGAEIEAVREESAALAARHEELIDEVSGLVGRRSTLEMECGALEERLRTIERDREARSNEIDDLRAMRDRLIEAHRAAEEESAAAQAVLARRRGDLVAVEAAVTATTATLEERRREAQAAEERLAALREEARREAAAVEQQLAATREEARLFGEEEGRLQRMAVEARREVEEEIEGSIRTLADLRVRHDSTAAALEALETRRREAGETVLRTEEETRCIEGRRAVAQAALEEAKARLTEIDTRLADREKMLGRLREEEGERAGRLDRLGVELERLESARATRADELLQLNERAALLGAEMTALEKERATRGMADLKDLRDLLCAREIKEREHIEKLLGDARVEFKQLQEDWVNEERGGTTNEELRRIRSEVEERRRELAKAERQLAAMRAGLSKLREENGRSLLKRAQSFEIQQLEELRRRIAESKNETEALEESWAGENR